MRGQAILLAGALGCSGLVGSAQAQPDRARLEDRVDFRGAAVLRGRVQFADGRAAANVPVVVEMRDGWKNAFGNRAGARTKFGGYGRAWMHLARAETTTREDGSYEIRGLASAAYDVRVKLREGNRVFAGPAGFAATPVLDVQLQNDVATHADDVVLSQGAIVAGRVVDQDTGEGLRGLLVGADGTGDALGLRVAVAVTDEKGRFSLRVPIGHFQVGVCGGGAVAYDISKFRVSGLRPAAGGAPKRLVFTHRVDGRDYAFTAPGGAQIESSSPALRVLRDNGFLAARAQPYAGQSIPLTIRAARVEIQLTPRHPAP